MMLSVKAGARVLGISSSKLYALVAQRRIASYRVGGKILLHESDVDHYLRSCRVEAEGRQPAATRSAGAFTCLNAARLADAWRKREVE